MEKDILDDYISIFSLFFLMIFVSFIIFFTFLAKKKIIIDMLFYY